MIPTDSSEAGDSERVVDVSGGLAGRVASDGMANLLRFAVSALSVFAVTPVISRTLDHGSFSVWTLVVTISTYIALADAVSSQNAEASIEGVRPVPSTRSVATNRVTADVAPASARAM
jgi:beta-lactamase regulating signal transducer with metallopeptidase domain